MSIELKVPEVGESITEVEIGEWLKQPGDSAVQDETICLIETDKITVELPAPVSGTITEVLKGPGEAASVGDVIGTMEEGEVAPSEDSSGESSEPSGADSAAAESEGEAPARESEGQEKVMPAARAELARRGLAAGDVEPSGPGGRLLKEDVQRHDPGASKSKAAPASAGSAARSAAPRGGASTDEAMEEVVPMSPLRRRVAERLVESQNQAALLTTFNEIDMSAVMELRNQHKEAFKERYGIKLGFMSFFVKACVDALRVVPEVNAEIRGTDVVYRNFQDIGVAVGGGKGLVVPVIRDAGRLSFAEVELTIADLATRARDNKLSLDELQGGTFTISNGGIYGSLLSTPIVNPPQSGILGMHAIQERPIAVNGQVEIRPMMYVALTYDHRLIDGREAVTFLKRIKECIESPERMLLEI